MGGVGCWQWVSGSRDASKAMMLLVSSSAILVIGRGCCLPSSWGGGAHAICRPSIPQTLAAVPLPWVGFFSMLLCSAL